MKVAVLGAGKIGFRHLESYIQKADNYGWNVLFFNRSFKSIGETYKRIISEGKKPEKDYLNYNPCIPYDNYKDMLKEKPNFLSICTPDDSHLNHLRTALDEGIENILIEKPLVPPAHLDECCKVLEEARKYEIKISVNLQMLAMKDELKKELSKINISYDEIEKLRPFEIIWTTNGNGNPVVDLMPHLLSIYDVNIDGMKKEILSNGLVRLKTDEGSILIGYNKEKVRGWSFGKFKFHYNPGDGQTEILLSYDNIDHSIKIKDPLKNSLDAFVKKNPFADARYGFENAKKTAEINAIY